MKSVTIAVLITVGLLIINGFTFLNFYQGYGNPSTFINTFFGNGIFFLATLCSTIIAVLISIIVVLVDQINKLKIYLDKKDEALNELKHEMGKIREDISLLL